MPHRAAPDVEREIGPVLRRGRHLLPELPKSCYAVFGRVSGDDRAVDCADRDTSDPVGLIVVFGQCFIDPGLIRAEGTTPLEPERELLVDLAPRLLNRRMLRHGIC